MVKKTDRRRKKCEINTNYSEDPTKNVIDSIDLIDNVLFCYQWLAETIHIKNTSSQCLDEKLPTDLPAEKWLTGGGDKDTKGSDEVNSEVGNDASKFGPTDCQVRYEDYFWWWLILG